MDAQFKKRVQAVQQSEHSRLASAATPGEHSATRHNHILPTHHPGLQSPPSGSKTAQTGKTTGGAIRTSVTRAARAGGPLGTPIVGRSVFGLGSPISSSTTAAASTAAASSPSRAMDTSLLSPMNVSVRRSSNAGLSTRNGTNQNSTGNNKTTDHSHSNGGSSESARNIAAQGASSHQENSANTNHAKNNTASGTLSEVLVGSGTSSTMRSPNLKSPTKKRYYDRFIPVREGGLSEQYDLLPEPSSAQTKGRIPAASGVRTINHYKNAQNQAHDTVIANELQLTHLHSPQEKLMQSTPRRLFTFSSTTTHNTMHFDSPSRQIYSTTPVSQESRNILLSPKKAPRSISKVPFKVLDAPELRDDFYLNLVDWSSKNVLGVGLGSCVYLWSALTSKVTQLCDLGTQDSVTSISWISMGSYLAVGTDSGKIQIWDVAAARRVRTMTGHTQRVGVLAWNDHILTSGGRDRNIYHRDVRSESMHQRVLSNHTGEVCGLKWNNAGTQLASGGNDNRLLVWERDSTEPLYKFRDHQAAVKAIDWNPHQSGVLASGGGSQDRHIRFWNTTSGTCIGATDTGSQVCNLAWSKTTNELVSTHGYSQNQIVVWKYPTMQQIASLSGHTMRVLYLALSPDGQTIVTGAGDETLRFWNVFQKNKSERKDDDGFSGTVATIR